jgi:hypothetical protein
MQTDISLSQFLAIQEKGVSAWEFEPELEIANCFVEARTEIEFFDSVCSVQSNLPVPKQNEVYYWEAKIYDKPETTTISIGMTTKPYPLFRLPGKFHVLPIFRESAANNDSSVWQATTKLPSPTYHPAIAVSTNHFRPQITDRNTYRAMLSGLGIDRVRERYSSPAMGRSSMMSPTGSSLKISSQPSEPTGRARCM